MKVCIVYFSGTGNTWFVANQLQRVLSEKGAEVALHSIEEAFMTDDNQVEMLIQASDKLIIGYPIYGSEAPRLMEKFIDRLPDVQCPKSVNVFTTVALYSGDGTITYRNLLEAKGYVYHTGKEFIMNNNFNVPGFPNMLRVGDDCKIEGRHNKVKPKIEKMAERIMSNNHKVQGKAVYDRALGKLQRAHVDKYIKKVNESLQVDEKACVNCNKCVAICPQNNILNHEGEIVFSNQCMACMRCYHLCPTQAINVTEESQDLEKWPRFNGVYEEFEKLVTR